MVLETPRLALRKFTPEDAPFILRLLNEPSFLHFIGDRNVRTLEDARQYLLNGPIASYEQYGFGLYLTVRKSDGVAVGMCGLLKRDALPEADIGFAFFPEFWSHGYARESASAVMEHARRVHGLTRILAIVSPDNERSIRLLHRLGMRFESTVRLSMEAPELKLFAADISEPEDTPA
ncbi:MAG TPA: GNAT family N-acetyltransferase [Steroidobacteraceae bacterium]